MMIAAVIVKRSSGVNIFALPVKNFTVQKERAQVLTELIADQLVTAARRPFSSQRDEGRFMALRPTLSSSLPLLHSSASKEQGTPNLKKV